jgi:hypothetical protein|eukprot:COSAG01_NODE_3743_length_5743_cov_10.259568_5_plen_360_part_00
MAMGGPPVWSLQGPVARRGLPVLLSLAATAFVPRCGQSLRCFHSTLANSCNEQSCVNTSLVDCGYSPNGCAYDSCELRATKVVGDPQILLSRCAASCQQEVTRSKCHQQRWGAEPWSSAGRRESSRILDATYWCCDVDGCNNVSLAQRAGVIEDPSAVGVGGDGGAAQWSGSSYAGWYYAQDPAWQDGTRGCVCDPSSFTDPCTPTVTFNPLLPPVPASELGGCVLMSAWTANQRRSKLEGLPGIPGFAQGIDAAKRTQWAAYCVHCDGGASAVHWYSDDRCSADKLVSSVGVAATGACTHDSKRDVYFRASCNVGPAAGGDGAPGATPPCPGTVANNLAFSVGVCQLRGTPVLPRPKS